jgi:hypothetical protein
MIGRELHMDEVALEKKTFAPGHGELHSGGGGRTFEATALAVPADAVSASTPPELQTLFSGAVAGFDAARAKHWNQAALSLKRIRAAQRAFRAGDLPKSLDSELGHAFVALAGAVHARKSQRASLAALDAASATLDLELRYRAPPEIDLARLRLWTLRLSTDAIARDRSAVTGDVATLQWIRDRIPLEKVDAGRIDDALGSLRAAAEADQLATVVRGAARLRDLLRGVRPKSAAAGVTTP